MIDLAGEIFDAHNDPEQLDVNGNVIQQLKHLHPATVSEYKDKNGPAVWILLIPTTTILMNQFLKKNISEQQLLDLTPVHSRFQSIYLCSAMVLPEYRGKGIAKRLTLEAIESIQKEHDIDSLFVWPFSKEGSGLAEGLSKETGLKLFKRELSV